MRFTGLEVENIFAYRGVSRVDLSACTPERNVVVITGRNGAGKTSLLNAIKLLFLGSNDDRMRRVIFGGTAIGAKHFVLGQPGRWYGVFNTAARGPDIRARVALEWSDEKQEFRAERCFQKANTALGYSETLTVTADGKTVPDGDAVLLQLLPKEVVPFFFFDGEQIQSIADAEVGREQAEIERLLGLSFVVTLTREVDSYAKAKQRAGLPENVQLKIIQAENRKREALARSEAANRARVAVEEEIQEFQQQQRRLENERNRLRTGISETDRRRMEGRIKLLQSDRERLAAEIAEQLPSESPWLTNLILVREAFQVLEAYLNGRTDPSLVERLHQQLPSELIRRLSALQPPITLNHKQAERFHEDVQEALEMVGVATHASNPLLASLSPRQVQSLHRRFLIWSERGESLATAHAERLRSMRQMTHEQQQAQRDLDEAEITTDEARQRFLELTEQLNELDKRVREHTESVAEHRIEEQRAMREMAQASDEIEHLESQFKDVTRQNRSYQLALKVKRALEDYREQRRARIRESVEARLNERVGVLLGPSQLIKSVALDEQFHMTYFDERNGQVARRSISAGMRQLVAMSMLWALKDEAHRPLPVMIDTPLGRIDRENRALLMTEYFPRAGNPLMLLPTNSEFAAEDYAHLASRIARRYEIHNTGGEDAQIIETRAAMSSAGQAI